MHEPEPRLSRIFFALSDPTRRAIVGRLAQGPTTVGELAAPFAISAPAVSKHMKVLESAGLGEEFTALNRQAVEIAIAARDAVAKGDVWIAGSISSKPPLTDIGLATGDSLPENWFPVAWCNGNSG